MLTLEDMKLGPKSFGASCFIFGNGPSILEIPNGLLKRILSRRTTFVVNQGYKLHGQVGDFSPSYYVVSNYRASQLYKTEFYKFSKKAKKCAFLRKRVYDDYIGTFSQTDHLVSYDAKGYMDGQYITSFPQDILCGHTVVVDAIQLAHKMGYRDIYLAGVDLDYSQDKKYFFGNPKVDPKRIPTTRALECLDMCHTAMLSANGSLHTITRSKKLLDNTGIEYIDPTEIIK